MPIFQFIAGRRVLKLFSTKNDLSVWLFLSLAVAAFTNCTKADNPMATGPASSANDQAAAAAGNSTINTSYNLGDVVRFGQDGGSERFRLAGWSSTEKDLTWSIGNSAKLLFTIQPSEQALKLRMRLAALQGVPQPVEVFANAQKIADWEVWLRQSTSADFTAVIPAGIVKDGGSLLLELKTPKAISPKALGYSEDPRVLGVICYELAITRGEQ